MFIKRLSLFSAALVLSFSAASQTWQNDLDLARIQLLAAEKHLQTAMTAGTDLAALNELHQAKTKFTRARQLYDDVVKQIEEESKALNWWPSRFTGYDESRRGSGRASDGLSESTTEMIRRMQSRGGARQQR